MRDPLTAINTRKTPQNQRANPRQVQNNAGGYVYSVDDLTRLRRFLVLGTEGGTYYASEKTVTADNAAVVLNFARTNGEELVREIVAISTSGRAPRQNPALFALAAAASFGTDASRGRALTALPLVARTGTHLFVFTRYVEQFRGWGPALRRAVAQWYLAKKTSDVAYQAVKYRQREDWTHRDLLRLAHPFTVEDDRKALFNWICGRDGKGAPELVGWFEAAQQGTRVEHWLPIIYEAQGISWEMLPDAALNEPAVWEALINKGMPITALMRQLPRLTKLGVLTQTGAITGLVASQLSDANRLQKGRVHPINVLLAQRTYAGGHGLRGRMEWSPVARITDALDAAFYAAFSAVVPTGKRIMLALDVSSSMMSEISGLPISCREASAALALVTAATEPVNMITGFCAEPYSRGYGRYGLGASAITPLGISARQRLSDAINAVSRLPFGGTDCALPMQWAQKNHIDFDTFVIYTDNETWAGSQHPDQALRAYRETSSINARLVVVAMTPTEFSIADPLDEGMLDIAGFDSAVPTLINDFARGSI